MVLVLLPVMKLKDQYHDQEQVVAVRSRDSSTCDEVIGPGS